MPFRRGRLDMSYAQAAPGRWKYLYWGFFLLVALAFCFGAGAVAHLTGSGVKGVVLFHAAFWAAVALFVLGRRLARRRRESA